MVTKISLAKSVWQENVIVKKSFQPENQPKGLSTPSSRGCEAAMGIATSPCRAPRDDGFESMPSNPILNLQALKLPKIRFVVGDQCHTQRDSVRGDQLIQRIFVAI